MWTKFIHSEFKTQKLHVFVLIMTTAGWIAHLVPVWVWSV